MPKHKTGQKKLRKSQHRKVTIQTSLESNEVQIVCIRKLLKFEQYILTFLNWNINMRKMNEKAHIFFS
jgi:hypothetical protein